MESIYSGKKIILTSNILEVNIKVSSRLCWAARHVIQWAMHANVSSHADLVKDLGCASPRKKKRWPSTAHKPMDYLYRALSCCASGLCQWVVPMGRASKSCQ